MRHVPLTEAKDQLSRLVDVAETTHEIITITRHGRPAAVLLAADDLESLQETVHWLSQPGVHDDVTEARAAAEAGDTADTATLRARLGLPG